MAYVSEQGKYVRIETEFWQDKDGSIHIVYNDGKEKGEFFHTTVNDEIGSMRRHHNLFGHLKTILIHNNRWNDSMTMKE